MSRRSNEERREEPTRPSPSAAPHIALLLHQLSLGGAERNMLMLADAFARRGCRVDLLVVLRRGALVEQVPPEVNLIELGTVSRLAMLSRLRLLPWQILRLLLPAIMQNKQPKVMRAIPRLLRYIEDARPTALLTTLPDNNVAAVLVKMLRRSEMRLVLREANSPSLDIGQNKHPFQRRLPELMRQCYPKADAIVAVSHGVAEDLSAFIGLSKELITAISNPIEAARIQGLASIAVSDDWFEPLEPPVLVAVGRLSPQKDYPTLLQAVALLRRDHEVRLLILGEGSERDRLQALAESLGIAAHVRMPGQVPNPYRYLARARLFVLSSAWEGFPNVVLEALACGCPVVSTDCRSGPREILDDGRIGDLVPVGDAPALAEGIARALGKAVDRDRLRARAEAFRLEGVVTAYLQLLLGTGSDTWSWADRA